MDLDINNLKAVFKKTEKGIEALKVRDPSLQQKSRVLLILIDGKKTLAELTPLLTIGSDSHLRIQELFNAGLISETLQEQIPTLVQTAPVVYASNVTTSADAAKNLQIAIRTATKLLNDMLGPNSEPLCLKLEKSKNKDEFNNQILELRKIVSAMRTERHGDEFVKAAIF